MRPVVWADEALKELDAATEYYLERNPDAGYRFRMAIDEAVADLAKVQTGRPGRIAGSTEKVLQTFPYIIAYKTQDDGSLLIMGIIHTSRDWPEGAWPKP